MTTIIATAAVRNEAEVRTAQQAAEQQAAQAVRQELNDLQLLMVGGGSGNAIFG
jgi:hypothetical protein